MQDKYGKEFRGFEYEVEERAGILQFDAGLNSVHALNRAKVQIRDRLIDNGIYFEGILDERKMV